MKNKTHLLTVLGVVAVLGSCGRGVFVDEADAMRAIEAHGYTDPSIVSSGWFAVGWRGCDEKDAAVFDVQATNAQGNRVGVLVCMGWPFKGATVRVP